MKKKLLVISATTVALVAGAWFPLVAPYFLPKLNVQIVMENGVPVGCEHFYSVPLKDGSEFRYQWRPELDAFIATNAMALAPFPGKSFSSAPRSGTLPPK